MATDRPPPAREPLPSLPPGAERRGELRAAIELKVEYRRLNSFFADYTRNISKGGTFIGTDKPLRVGTEFVFQITVPGATTPRVFELKGRVAWTAHPDPTIPQRPSGMGIRFLFDDDADRGRIQKDVEDLMIETFGEELARRLLAESETESA